MKVFVYPGSFDPVTNGHVDIIERASGLCDKLFVAVLINQNKTPWFSLEERVAFIKESISHLKNVEVRSFHGLLIDFMSEINASVIIKGLRAVSDFEYELQMALLNKKLKPEIETLFIMTNIKYSFLSSSSVRELARFKGKIDGLVPSCIEERIYSKLLEKKS